MLNKQVRQLLVLVDGNKNTSDADMVFEAIVTGMSQRQHSCTHVISSLLACNPGWALLELDTRAAQGRFTTCNPDLVVRLGMQPAPWRRGRLTRPSC